MPADERSTGEAWAQAQLDKGLPVSFPADWPPEDRRLGGPFVADALRRWSASPAPPLFSIENAVITTALTLHAAGIASEVCFERCVFAAATSFRDVTFAHRVRFAECVFEDDLSLEACRIRELWLVKELDLAATADRPGTIVRGAFSVMNSAIAVDLVCDGARFRSDRTAVFNSLTVDGSLFLRRATFSGGAYFTFVTVGSTFNADHAGFLNRDSPIGLANMRIAGYASFASARFHGPVNLNNTQVTGTCSFIGAWLAGPATFIGLTCGSAQFDRARFLDLANEDAGADFNSARIARHASFTNAQFRGAATFRAMEVGGTLNFSNASFQSRKTLAAFDSIKVASHALFGRSRFEGGPTFQAATLNGDADFSGAVFGAASTFERCTIGGNLHFLRPSGGERPRGTVFAGSVNADTLTVAGMLLMQHARFAPGADLTLRGARTGYLSVLDTRFSDVTLFSAQSALALVFQDATVRKDLDLSNVKVGGPARFRGVRVRGRVKSSHADVSGSLSIERYYPGGDKKALPCIFKGPADFSNSRFQSDTHLGEAITGGTKDDISLQFGADATFDHCVFGGKVSMERTVFVGDASFSAARFLSRVALVKASFTSTKREAAVFAEAEFRGQVVMQETTVAGRLSLFGIRAHHNVRIGSSCRFGGEVDVRGASFTSLHIEDDRGQPPPRDLSFLGTFKTDGWQYQRIECALGLNTFWEFLRRCMVTIGQRDATGFTRQPYLQFEQFCRTSGENDLADEVYMDFRREEGRHDTRLVYKAWNQVERAAFGYGAKPLRMLGWFVAALVAGALLLALPLPPSAQTMRRALAFSFANLVPGTSDFVDALRPAPTRWTVIIGFTQHAIGWVLLALVAERFFKGLKR